MNVNISNFLDASGRVGRVIKENLLYFMAIVK